MKSFGFLLILLSLLVVFSGCGQIGYLSKLGWHQGAIAYQSIPVEELLQDDQVSSEIKAKIRFIQDVKHYGEETLGLKKTKSYSRFYETRGPILYIVTACEKDRLRLRSWEFPLVGEVTYKGFFSKEEALRERDDLSRQDHDTYVQAAAAYSTLGWMNDPIFSSMTQSNPVALANLVLHEMTHATLYVRGKTDFNEQVATFIGNRGAIEYLTQKYGRNSREVTDAIDIQQDDLIFSRWVDLTCRRLSEFYASDISREEKLKGREVLFQSVKEDFNEIRAELKTEVYQGFDRIELNNAVLLAYHRYVHRLETYDLLYERLGNDLRRVVEFFKQIPSTEQEPSSYIDRWLNEG
jgi:predicted aminopeptidase